MSEEPTSTAAAFLQDIYDRHGVLVPRMVWMEASDPAHPMHSRFTWDDEVGGALNRDREAANLIRRIRIRRIDPDSDQAPRVRRWVSVQRPDQPRPSYEPIEQVAADPVSSAVLLRNMQRDWRLFKDRYKHMATFVELVRNDPDIALDEAAG